MTTYKWFYIFNEFDFNDLDLVSKTYTVILDGIGQKDFLVTRNGYLGVTYADVFLRVETVYDDNGDLIPIEHDGFAVFRDGDSNIWWGFPV